MTQVPPWQIPQTSAPQTPPQASPAQTAVAQQPAQWQPPPNPQTMNGLPAQAYPPPAGLPFGGAPVGYPSPGAPQPYPPQQYAAPQALAQLGNPLAGVGDAKSFAKSPYFPLGDFVVAVEEIKGVVSQDPARLGAVMIVIECSVISSNVQGVIVGNHYAQIINMNKYGQADLKSVITALNGGTPGNPEHEAYVAQQGAYTEAKIREMISPANPMRGRKLSLRTVFKANRNPQLAAQGKGFTNHYWGPGPR